MRVDLEKQELLICYLHVNTSAQDTLPLLLSGLTDTEEEHAQKKLRPQDQFAFAAGRALVRHMLSMLADAPAGGWRFQRDPLGKPALVPFSGCPDFRFNLSHTEGLVAAVVTVGRDVGIDAEFRNEAVDYIGITEAFFSTAEVDLVRAADGDLNQRNTFFALWTIKEAYLKARGNGFSMALSDFAVSLDPLSITPSADPAVSPHEWFVWQDQPTLIHHVAVVARKSPGEELRCRLLEVRVQDLLTQ